MEKTYPYQVHTNISDECFSFSTLKTLDARCPESHDRRVWVQVFNTFYFDSAQQP